MGSMSMDDYEQLKAFLGFYYDWYMAKPNSDPKVHPLLVLEQLEKESLSKAKRGLEMAINDCAERSSDWTPEQVAEAEARFLNKKVIGLSEVRRRYSKKYLNLIKRGHIKTEQEYYLLQGIASGGGIEPGAKEKEQIELMLAEYEKKAGSAPKQK